MSSPTFVRRRIAPDGSCLFNSVDFLSHDGVNAPDAATEMRSFCVSSILSDPDRFNEVYLGRPPSEYCDWIGSPHTYGGEVEIVLLANRLSVQINVCSIESLTVLPYSPDSYAQEDPSLRRKMYILYNGQHYDALVGGEDGRCTFPLASSSEGAGDDGLEAAAVKLLVEEKTKRDIELRTRKRKKIKCSCGFMCSTPAEFQVHAETWEHDDDWGYDCEEVEVEEMVAKATDD